MARTGDSPSTIIEKRGLVQISDEEILKKIIEKVVKEYPDKVEKYRKGKKGLMGFFVGQVMKETKGKANPKLVNKLLGEALENDK